LTWTSGEERRLQPAGGQFDSVPRLSRGSLVVTMTLSALLTESINDDISESDARILWNGLRALGEEDLESGPELDALALEILVAEAVDAETVKNYKAHRAAGANPGRALFHAREKTAKDKGDAEKREKLQGKYALHNLDKRGGGRKLRDGEKMVFGRVVKSAA
jgi:hypothetical protein